MANRYGPVRAIRSYLGANSGPFTQRDHVFYERRHDIRTALRVHPIVATASLPDPGMMDFFDYAPGATPLTYRNSLNTAGVTVDGTPDTVTSGVIPWEMVQASQGTLVLSHALTASFALTGLTSYYLDDSTPPATDPQCTGDAAATGSSGIWLRQALPNTDPVLGAAQTLVARRTIYYEGTGLTVADAQAHNAWAGAPLGFSVALWQASPAIGVSPASLTFNAPVGGPNPAAQTLTVTNTGGGVLDWSASEGAGWMSLASASGSLGPGASADITVSVDVAGLAAGPQNATIQVAAPGASNTPVNVPVTLNVNASPTIGLAPTALTFDAPLSGPNPASRTFTVTNTGGGTLGWAATEGVGWMSLTGASGSLGPGASATVTVSVDVTGLTAQAYNASIQVSAAGASNTPQSVAVTLNVNALPTIGLDATGLSFSATEGGANPASQALVITNTGAGSLDWTLSDNAGWLSGAPAAGSLAAGAQATVTVSADIAGLAAGTFSATITVSAAGASNSPQTLSVVLTVTLPAAGGGGGGGGGRGGCGTSGLEALLLLALVRRAARLRG